MPRTNQQSESSYAKQQRRRAERIIQAAEYPAEVRDYIQDVLDNEPSRLPRLFAVIDEFDRKATEFKSGIHEFASKAYSAALDYYVKHYDDPAALAAFTRALAPGRRGKRGGHNA